jgi:hypothetical protein
MKQTSLLAAVVLLILVGACDSNNNPTAPTVTPEPEPVPTVTETFTGALALGGASCHFFDVTQPGPLTMSIVELAPLDTLTLGLGVGLPDEAAATGCGLFVNDTSVRKDESFLAAVNTVGPHCVCIFDVGNIFADQNVTYTLDVEHP